MQKLLQVLFLLQFPCPLSITETIPSSEGNQPKLQRSLTPRTIIAHCTPHQRLVIDETLDNIHILVEAGAWASSPERSPVSLATLDQTQHKFMRFFHTIDNSARRLVQQRYEAIGKAIRNSPNRQSIVIRCDDPLNKCHTNFFPWTALRRPGIPIYHFFQDPGAGSRPGSDRQKDIVIPPPPLQTRQSTNPLPTMQCPRFSTLPSSPPYLPSLSLSPHDHQLLLHETYSAHDRTSLLFIFLALNRVVWSPTYPVPLPYDVGADPILNLAEYVAFARSVVGDYQGEVRRRLRGMVMGAA
ncbi:MAG: hypothetical protein Q9160_002670 [Pyrenula sp. 1 TL-2023]